MQKNILVIEDDTPVVHDLKNYLSKEYNVAFARTAEEMLDILSKTKIDLILLDATAPGMQSVDLLKNNQHQIPEIPIIMLTSIEDIKRVVACVELGAQEYLSKPFQAVKLVESIESTLRSFRKGSNVSRRQSMQLEENRLHPLKGVSPEMAQVRKEIAAIAKSDVSVLIQGETGTGKELVAREIHASSSRENQPFIALNCGAIPKELIESELFGHEKGAFTSAHKTQIGKFQLADYGTLVLDEIGELSMQAQIKLLRVLEVHEFYSVGGSQLKRVDVRIIASTNRDLEVLSEQQLFREDLFYRLNVFTITIPPLRKRKDDILFLAEFFVTEYNKKFGKNIVGITANARDVLLKNKWRGNVRELRNSIERAVLFAEGNRIKAENLYFIKRKSASEEVNRFIIPEAGINLEEIEKKYIMQALKLAKYNKTKAAKLLHITPPTLYYRLEKYDLG